MVSAVGQGPFSKSTRKGAPQYLSVNVQGQTRGILPQLEWNSSWLGRRYVSAHSFASTHVEWWNECPLSDDVENVPDAIDAASRYLREYMTILSDDPKRYLAKNPCPR